MKKTITITLVLVLALALLAACGSKDNTDSAGGDSTPGASQSADNDTSKPADNNGGASDNKYEWPDDKWTQHMPKPTGELSDDPTEDVPGSTSSTCWFTIIGGRDDAQTYVEQLKTYGYTEDSVSETEQEYTWKGTNEEAGYYIQVNHFISEFGITTDYDIIIANHK